MTLAVPLGNACPLVAGRGHGQIYNSLIIRYHLPPKRGIAAVFWPQFHAPFHKTLKINALQDKTWPHHGN